MQKLVTVLASLIFARENCQKSGNTEWFAKHTERLEYLADNYLPSGSGVDNGARLDLDASKPEKIVLSLSFHHMDEGGSYDGWTDHVVTVRPSFVFGYHIGISGRDRNNIKEYLSELLREYLDSPVDLDALFRTEA